MAFTSQGQINAALPGQHKHYLKNIPLTVNIWSSSWIAEGPPPGDGFPPMQDVAGVIPTSATPGGVPFINAPGGQETRIGRISASPFALSSGAGMLALYDRLWHNNDLDNTVLTAQPINSIPLTRPDASGSMAELWWETYLAMGIVTPILTVTYTDQDGNAGNAASSGTLPTTLGQGRTGPFQLAAGDTGVRSVQAYQANASFIYGNIGLVLRRCIAMKIINVGTNDRFDALGIGLPRVYDDACLEFLWYTVQITTSVTWQSSIELSLIQG